MQCGACVGVGVALYWKGLNLSFSATYFPQQSQIRISPRAEKTVSARSKQGEVLLHVLMSLPCNHWYVVASLSWYWLHLSHQADKSTADREMAASQWARQKVCRITSERQLISVSHNLKVNSCNSDTSHTTKSRDVLCCGNWKVVAQSCNGLYTRYSLPMTLWAPCIKFTALWLCMRLHV